MEWNNIYIALSFPALLTTQSTVNCAYIHSEHLTLVYELNTAYHPKCYSTVSLNSSHTRVFTSAGATLHLTRRYLSAASRVPQTIPAPISHFPYKTVKICTDDHHFRGLHSA